MDTDVGRVVVPLSRFDELRHDEIDETLRDVFAGLIAKAAAAAKNRVVDDRRERGEYNGGRGAGRGGRGHGRGGRHGDRAGPRHGHGHGHRHAGPPGWKRAPAEGKRPLKVADSEDAAAREVVGLCNKLSKGNFVVVSRKLTAHADGGDADSVIREILDQSARHGTFNSLYTDLLSSLALGHAVAVEEEVARRGDAFVARAGHLLADALWSEDYDAFCAFVAARKRQQSEFRSLCVMGYVQLLGCVADDALRMLPDPECGYSKDMLAEILCTFYQFDASRGEQTTAAFNRCIGDAEGCGIATKTRFVLMDMLPRVRPQQPRRPAAATKPQDRWSRR